MKNRSTSLLKTALTLAALALGTHAAAQVTFYEHDGFTGRTFTTQRAVESFERSGFNDRASSVVVLGTPWEVCEDANFGGRCTVLRAGQYPSLSSMGLNDRVSSVRAVSNNARIDDDRYAPPAQPAYDNRRRRNERLYEANVTSVRAVVGTPEQRCWIEQEPVARAPRGNANVPGALIGAVIGGVLGHQVGGGSGRDVATAGGAVVGAVVGANVGRGGDRGEPQTQDVQRCASEPGGARPGYYDVTYDFRGQQHRMQMTTAPGPTVTVNRRGEPRAVQGRPDLS
jgi:uncharacterized protein YcfJ